MVQTTEQVHRTETETYQLKAGDVQNLVFQVGDAPPWKQALKPKDKEGGWVGQPKGTKQILYERGLWVKGMQLTPKTDDALDATKRLQACPDFRDEKGMVQTLVEKRGGRFLITPKYHCESAGMGVEYSWRKAKQYSRKINDKIPRIWAGMLIGRSTWRSCPSTWCAGTLGALAT